MKWYVLLLSIHFKCTYIPIRYIFRVEPQIFDLRIYFWLVGPIKAFRQMTEIFLFVQDLASFSSFLQFKCASGTIKKYVPKVRSFFKEHSCEVLTSIKIVIIFNNTSADFALISTDVILKIITILKEMRIAQLCSYVKWKEFSTKV